MSQNSVHEIRWNEVCPWLILVQALRASVFVRVLLLSFVGMAVTQWGWAALDAFFSSEPIGLSEQLTGWNESMVAAETADGAPAARNLQLENISAPTLYGPLVRAGKWLAAPFILLIDQDTTWLQSIGLILSGLWAIVVWALVGGVITRICAMFLTRHELIGPGTALRSAVSHWGAAVGAPLLALLGLVLLGLPLIIAGGLLRSEWLTVIGGLLWGVALVWGLGLTLLAILLLIGWPLMWATLGVERTDAFDGVSRCFAYVYQRPLHLAFYLFVATVLGLVGEAVIYSLADATIYLTEWIVSWGAGTERAAQLFGTAESIDSEPLTTSSGPQAIQIWKNALASIAASYPIAFFWSATTAIYLLLRRHIDSTEMDEISLDAYEEQQSDSPPTRKD